MTPPPASTAGTSRTLLASNERVGELSDLLAKAVGDGRDHFEQDALLASRRSTRTQQLVLFGGLAGIAFAALMGSRSPEQTSSRNWLSVSTTPSKREASAATEIERSVGRSVGRSVAEVCSGVRQAATSISRVEQLIVNVDDPQALIASAVEQQTSSANETAHSIGHGPHPRTRRAVADRARGMCP